MGPGTALAFLFKEIRKFVIFETNDIKKMATYHKLLCTKLITVLALGFLLNLPSYSIAAQVSSASEIRYLSRLIDQYGKHTIIDRILKLRNGKITVEIEGIFKDSIGRPQYSYITAKSLLKDIRSMGLSIAQFGRMVMEAMKEKQLRSSIEADYKQEAELQAKAYSLANAEREQRRTARRRNFLAKYGGEGNGKRTSDANTNGEGKNSKRKASPKTAVLKAGQIATVSESYLDEAYQHLAVDDLQALTELMEAGVVLLLQQGVKVYVLDRKIWRGRVKIRIEGTKTELWTALASIQP